MPPIRTVQQPPAPVVSAPNFFDAAFYSGGFQLPEGDYALFFFFRMFKGGQNQTGAERLGVMLNAYPLNGAEPHEQFLSMGSKAHLSFLPNPDDEGKTLVAVPGGPGSVPNSTNWSLFLDSLKQTGLPAGLPPSLTSIDGVWCHTSLMPEPEERKGFGQAAKTAMPGAAPVQEERKGSGLTVVVTQILDGGKPWEGTGGMPTAGSVAAAAPKVAPGPRPITAARPTAVTSAAPVAVAAAPVGDDEEIAVFAANAIADVLTKTPAGLSKLAIRAAVFKQVAAKGGAPLAQAVAQAIKTDENLAGFLLPVGYALSADGSQVAPQA